MSYEEKLILFLCNARRYFESSAKTESVFEVGIEFAE